LKGAPHYVAHKVGGIMVYLKHAMHGSRLITLSFGDMLRPTKPMTICVSELAGCVPDVVQTSMLHLCRVGICQRDKRMVTGAQATLRDSERRRAAWQHQCLASGFPSVVEILGRNLCLCVSPADIASCNACKQTVPTLNTRAWHRSQCTDTSACTRLRRWRVLKPTMP